MSATASHLYDELDATALAGAVRRGEVEPEALLDEAARRMATRNPAINAVIVDGLQQARDELAQRRAAGTHRQGLLAGVPVLVKDLLASVRGLSTWHGSRMLKSLLPVADHDSEFIARLRASGALIIGKTATPEFGLTPYTEPELTGPTRNPWNPSLTCGGSSGGSAAAVAARIVPLATGGDGGGSIRIPASCCGLFGLKPTRGRVPSGPDMGELWSGLAIEHGLTRSVRDSAALLDVVAGPDAGAPHVLPPPARPFVQEADTEPGALRIGVCTEPWLGRQVHPDCVAAVEQAASLLKSLGHAIVEAPLPIERRAFAEAFTTVICANVRAELLTIARLAGRRPTRHDVEPATWAAAMLGQAIDAGELIDAQHQLQATTRAIARRFETFDVLLTPTLAAPPVPIGALGLTAAERWQVAIVGSLGWPRLLRWTDARRQMAEKMFDFIPWTPVFNVTGQPAMSVPLHWNDAGLPIGVQMAGRFGDEATLLRLAGQLERAKPWADRRPALAVR